ncbi:MAG: toll/interleukin-1 receptor domain-containing protein [Verrucomicrobiota bacterium]
MTEIFVLSSFHNEDKRVFETIRLAAESQGVYAFRKDEIGGLGNLHQIIRQAVEEADLIIADLTGAPPSVMYELGFAHCLAKPVILMYEAAAQVIYDLREVPALIYSRDAPLGEFREKLENLISEAKIYPDRFRVIPPMPSQENRVFISYSHQDKSAVERLMVHLGPLQKQGKVDVWADTRLKAGDRWKEEIGEALKHCSIAVLLVSADFLF